jgi:hypothetical protein
MYSFFLINDNNAHFRISSKDINGKSFNFTFVFKGLRCHHWHTSQLQVWLCGGHCARTDCILRVHCSLSRASRDIQSETTGSPTDFCLFFILLPSPPPPYWQTVAIEQVNSVNHYGYKHTLARGETPSCHPTFATTPMFLMPVSDVFQDYLRDQIRNIINPHNQMRKYILLS